MVQLGLLPDQKMPSARKLSRYTNSCDASQVRPVVRPDALG